MDTMAVSYEDTAIIPISYFAHLKYFNLAIGSNKREKSSDYIYFTINKSMKSEIMN